MLTINFTFETLNGIKTFNFTVNNLYDLNSGTTPRYKNFFKTNLGYSFNFIVVYFLLNQGGHTTA